MISLGKTQKHMVQMELDPRELQKEVDDMRAGAETLEALKHGHYHYAEDDGTLEALKQGAGDYELQKRVDEMRELQTLIHDLRAGDKTLEALSLSHYELQQMVDDMREMCADGSAGGVGILEEQMNTLQKIGDEMRAGETQVSAGASTGSTGTPEGRREGIPSMCDGGNGAMMIGADSAAAEKSVARGLIIDPGGEIIKAPTAEIEKDPGGKGATMIGTDPAAEENSVARELMIDPGGGDNIYAGGGKIFYPEITGKWRRNNPGGGHNAPARGGRIKDPGGEEYRPRGSPTDFEKCVDQLVNNEVPRKVYEVQENKDQENQDHRSVKEDEGDARLPAEKAKDAEAEKANQMANEHETRKEEPKKFVQERAENEAIYEVICGG